MIITCLYDTVPNFLLQFLAYRLISVNIELAETNRMLQVSIYPGLLLITTDNRYQTKYKIIISQNNICDNIAEFDESI